MHNTTVQQQHLQHIHKEITFKVDAYMHTNNIHTNHGSSNYNLTN